VVFGGGARRFPVAPLLWLFFSGFSFLAFLFWLLWLFWMPLLVRRAAGALS